MNMSWNVFYCTVADLINNFTFCKLCLLHMFYGVGGAGVHLAISRGNMAKAVQCHMCNIIIAFKVASTSHDLANQKKYTCIHLDGEFLSK